MSNKTASMSLLKALTARTAETLSLCVKFSFDAEAYVVISGQFELSVEQKGLQRACIASLTLQWSTMAADEQDAFANTAGFCLTLSA
jgi:hypothetical protein